MNDNTVYLAHHGILGQKWGVRRFQNSDGSLKSAGRTRYGRHDKMDTHDKNDSSVTRRVKSDYNKMSNREFKAKYQTSKNTYRHRVNRKGDPYANRSSVNKAALKVSQKYANSKAGKMTVDMVHNVNRRRAQTIAMGKDLAAGYVGAKVMNIASNVAYSNGKNKVAGMLQMGAGAIQIGSAVKAIKDGLDINKEYKNSRRDVDKAIKKESKQIDEITRKTQKNANKNVSVNPMKTAQKNTGKAMSEIDKLMSKNPGLKSDFGGSSKMIDDPEYFEYVARTEYGLNTNELRKYL